MRQYAIIDRYFYNTFPEKILCVYPTNKYGNNPLNNMKYTNYNRFGS